MKILTRVYVPEVMANSFDDSATSNSKVYSLLSSGVATKNISWEPDVRRTNA